MFNKNNWRQPIYKNDVKTVIIFGLTAAILGGILTGLIDATLANLLGLGISFSLLLNSLIIGFSIKKGYEEYHILYPVLALGFFVLALIISQLSFYVGIYGIENIGSVLSNPNTYLNILLLPIKYLFVMINQGFNVGYLLYLILNILFYILAFIAVYRIAKGNRR